MTLDTNEEQLRPKTAHPRHVGRCCVRYLQAVDVIGQNEGPDNVYFGLLDVLHVQLMDLVS